MNTICGVKVGLGGSRNHTRMPKLNLGRLRVDMTGLLTILKGGKSNGIMYMGNEPQ